MTQSAAPSASGRRVPWFQIFSYVAPSLPLAAVGMPLVVHLPQFYASHEVGIPLAMTGFVFMVLRMIDVFFDPLAGFVSDRWRTRWGRRKPMMALGTPLLAIGLWFVFVPGGPVSPWYLGFWLFVMYLGWSSTVIPHLSWGAELSTEYHERSRIYGWSQASTVIGMVGVLVLPAILENAGTFSMAAQVMAMAVFSIVFLLPTVVLNLWFVPEPEVKLNTHAGILPTIRFLMNNGSFWRVIGADLLVSTSAGATGAMFFFFSRLALDLPKISGTLLLAYFVTGCVCIPLWIRLAHRVGKHRALMVSFVYSCLTMPILLFVPAGSFAWALAAFLVIGINYSAPTFLLRSMMADIADADTAETNAERAGVMYSFLALTAKLGFAIAVGVTFSALSAVGFDPKIVNTPEAIDHMRMVYVIIPVVVHLLGLAVLYGYKLDETKQRRLREEIEQRRSAPHPASPGIYAADPVTGTVPPGLTLSPEGERL